MPCPSWATDASTTLDVTALVISIATVLSASELISLRGEFRIQGLFDPRVVIATRPSVLTRRLAMVSMPRVAGAQLAIAVAILVCLAAGVSPTLLLVALAAAIVLQRFALTYGTDGSDEMARILTITAAIAFVFSTNSTVVRIALVFIAAQLCLAYGASGVAKLFGRPWRSGTAARGILHTSFGHPGVVQSTVDRWPSAGKVVSRLVIAFEIAFPVGIVLGGWVALGALVAAALFQASIAATMGLNRFTPWFLAAFPATAWAACQYGVLS